MRVFVLTIASIVGAAFPAMGGQTNIPLPYPITVPGAQPLDPAPARGGGPQENIADPYPQLLGNNAQGNPPIAKRTRNQRLVPSISQRKYRVDRPEAGQ